jgi:hypothetical protein
MANALGAEIERWLAIDSAVAELQADLERCRLCGAPALVELFTGYWLLQPLLGPPWARCHDALRGLTRTHTRCEADYAFSRGDPTHADYVPAGVS